jgi:hypothetical protein
MTKPLSGRITSDELDARAYNPKGDDDKFQQAMIAAGYFPDLPCSTPGTEAPRPMMSGRVVAGGSSMGDF